MNVLLIASDFYPTVGGYANAIANLSKALLDTGLIRLSVLTLTPLNDAEEIGYKKINVVRINKYSGALPYKAIVNQFRLGSAIAGIIRDYDFVMFETFENPIAIWLGIRGLTEKELNKVAVRIHGCTETEIFMYSKRLRHRVYWYLLKKLARRLPNIVSTTQYYIDFFKNRVLNGNIFYTFKNYCIIPNVSFPSHEVKNKIEKKENIHFLALGRMSEQGMNQKNFELLAQSMFLIKKNNPYLFPKIRVTIIGQGSMSSEYEQLLEHLAIRDAFTLESFVPHDAVRRLQASVHSVILVSRYEGQSMFALESLAAGAPLIVATGTGVTHLVEDGVNGWVINGDDPLALAEAMQRISTSRVEELKKASKDIYHRDFGPEKIASRLIDYMEYATKGIKRPVREL